jgi:hypothetical protein
MENVPLKIVRVKTIGIYNMEFELYKLGKTIEKNKNQEVNLKSQWPFNNVNLWHPRLRCK